MYKRQVATCPKGLIQIVPYSAEHLVQCSSHDKGKDVKAACQAGCIGCTLDVYKRQGLSHHRTTGDDLFRLGLETACCFDQFLVIGSQFYIEVLWFCPVSYTHLDVYKRQISARDIMYAPTGDK